MKRQWHICSFEAVDLPQPVRGKRGRIVSRPTYEEMRAAVLRAGRFSVFEATETQERAAFYTRLARDPEIEMTPDGFPWSSVRLKAQPARAIREEAGR